MATSRTKSTTFVVIGIVVVVVAAVGVVLLLANKNSSPKPVAAETTTTLPGGVSATTLVPNSQGGETVVTLPSITVPKGDVALSVRVDMQQAVDGYVHPGSQVDVYASYTDKALNTVPYPAASGGSLPQGTKFDAASMVLSNVTVLAVSEPPPASTGGLTNLVLELSPSDAAKVIETQEYQTLWAALVGPGSAPVNPGSVQYTVPAVS